MLTYLGLATNLRQARAQVEWFLEPTTSFSLRRDRVTACVNITVIVGAGLLSALLARSRGLLLPDLALVTATSRTAAGQAILLRLKLSS